MLLNDVSKDRVPGIELGQTNIIFNIPHPSIVIHIHDKASRNAILLLIQEVKRDLIYRRMNLPPSAQRVTDPRRLAAHLDSTIRRLRSYLQYIGLMKYKKAADMLLRLQEHNLAWGFLNWQPCLCFSFVPWLGLPNPCQHCHMCMHSILSTHDTSDTQLHQRNLHMYAPPPPPVSIYLFDIMYSK